MTTMIPTPHDIHEWSDGERSLFDQLRAGRAIVINRGGRLWKGTDGFKRILAYAREHNLHYYCGRPSHYGNPFRPAERTAAAHQAVVDKYRQHLLNDPYLLAGVSAFAGRVICCDCKPLPCHGDILAELANKSLTPPQP